MPYRLDPKDRRCVQIQEGGIWKRLKCHPTPGDAAKHLAALVINVEDAKKGIELQGEFQKLDEDQRLVFGWASVAQDDQGALVDKQGDVLDVPTLELAVYEYVLKSRRADEMHQVDDVGVLVESILFTPEKVEKMGLPPGSVPLGWWVGFKVTSDRVWDRVKAGEYRMFSIRGSGVREDLPSA